MIRPIKIEDKKDWEKLYRGYADFYKVEMSDEILTCLLYTSPSPRDYAASRMPSSA